jgi:predicted transcriptional regulator
MASTEPTTLQSFHSFLSKQLETDAALPKSPEEILAQWREEQDTLSAIREGLADVEAGRTKSLAEFEQDIRQKFGFAGSA